MDSLKTYSRVFLAGMLLPFLSNLAAIAAFLFILVLNLDRFALIQARAAQLLDYLEGFKTVAPAVVLMRQYLGIKSNDQPADFDQPFQPPANSAASGYELGSVPLYQQHAIPMHQ